MTNDPNLPLVITGALVRPPVPVALARPARSVPSGAWAFEPKFDGWRAVVFTSAGVVQSRAGKNLAHRFPTVLSAARELGDLVLDGELVAFREGRLDFPALATGGMQPAVRVHLVVFDLLAAGQHDLRMLPYHARRAHLEHVLADVPSMSPVQLMPMTTDRIAALTWFDPRFNSQGIEGLVAKPLHAPYRGRRGPWLKIRRTLVLDADVIGLTGPATRPEALVLALPDHDGAPRAVGVSTTIPAPIRAALAGQLHQNGEPRELAGIVAGLPGQPATRYIPVAPGVVVEIEADACIEFGRFRHRPRLLRIVS